jgi:phosphohistidine phosphatase SixA
MTSYLILLRHANAVAKEVRHAAKEVPDRPGFWALLMDRSALNTTARASQVDATQPLDVDGLVSASTAGVELSAIFAGYGIHTARLWHSKATRSKQTADQLVKVRADAHSLLAD